MLQVTKEVVTDVTTRCKSKAILAKQNDDGSRFLKVHIQESGKNIQIKDNVTVTLNVQRPDTSAAMFFGSVNDDGTVEVELNSWILEQVGTVSCDISLLDPENSVKLTTMTFYVEVEASACTDDDIKEDPEYTVLLELVKQTKDAKNMAEMAAEQAAQSAEQVAEAVNQSNEAIQDCDEATQLAKDAAAGVVTIEQNSQQQLRFWLGTQAEYDALTEIVPNCFYIIDDDELPSADVTQDIAELREAVDAIIETEETTATEIENLGKNVEDCAETVENLSTSVDDLGKSVEDCAEAVEDLGKDLDEIDTKTTQELNNIKEDIGWLPNGNGGFTPLDRTISNIYDNSPRLSPIDKYNCMFVTVVENDENMKPTTLILSRYEETASGEEGGFEGYGVLSYRFNNDSELFIAQVYVNVPYKKEVDATGLASYRFLTPTVKITDSEGSQDGIITKAILIL